MDVAIGYANKLISKAYATKFLQIFVDCLGKFILNKLSATSILWDQSSPYVTGNNEECLKCLFSF